MKLVSLRKEEGKPIEITSISDSLQPQVVLKLSGTRFHKTTKGIDSYETMSTRSVFNLYSNILVNTEHEAEARQVVFQLLEGRK